MGRLGACDAVRVRTGPKSGFQGRHLPVKGLIADALAREHLPATIRVDGDKLFIDYESTASGSGYVASSVMLEFGARSTGEPASKREVSCDAAGHVDGVDFPTAQPRVMHAERTFWEKATEIHVYCRQGRLRGDRFARHWHDVVQLDEVGIAAAAIADPALAHAVAQHKAMFFAEKSADGTVIDYEAAVRGNLQLLPTEEGLDALADDYRHMVADGLLHDDDAAPFDELMARCAEIANRANQAAHSGG